MHLEPDLRSKHMKGFAVFAAVTEQLLSVHVVMFQVPLHDSLPFLKGAMI